MLKTPLPCFFLPQLPLPSWIFFFVPSLAFPTLHFCVKYPDAQDRLDFVFPTSLRHTPPPLAVPVCAPPPFPIDLFYFTIPPDLLFFTNLRHTLLHFKSTPPHPPTPHPPTPDFVFFVSLRHILLHFLRQQINRPPFVFATSPGPQIFPRHPPQFSLLSPENGPSSLFLIRKNRTNAYKRVATPCSPLLHLCNMHGDWLT